MEGEEVKTVYAFIRNTKYVDPGALHSLFSSSDAFSGGRIVYWTYVSGPYTAFVKAELEDLSELPGLVNTLLGKGHWGIETLDPTEFGPTAPKVARLAPADHEALVIVCVKPGVKPGTASQVLKEIGARSNVNGCARVDINTLLAVVRGTDDGDVDKNIESDIGSNTNVADTNRYFIIGDHYIP